MEPAGRRPISKPSMPASITRASRYALVRSAMARYISPILVDSVLGKAMHSRGVDTGECSGDALSGVVEESMIGLRLFVDASRLPDLMLELVDILQKEDG
jgi:hypothetical protein